MAQDPPPSDRKTAKKTSPSRSDEEEPVLSGRMVTALAFALAMSVIPVSGLGQYIEKTAPETAARALWKVGQTANIHLTVVTADYNHLACAMKDKHDQDHCEFKNDREKFPALEAGP